MGVPERVGVYGGGRMGAGIAFTFLANGSTVQIIERDAEACEGAIGRVRASLEKSGADVESALQRLSAETDAATLAGVYLALEAIRMVEQGVASAKDIDTAMELGYGHPSGPLKTTDIVGLDVRLAIAEYLESTLGERFAPPQLMRDLVAQGKLGRKTGEGFYTW